MIPIFAWNRCFVRRRTRVSCSKKECRKQPAGELRLDDECTARRPANRTLGRGAANSGNALEAYRARRGKAMPTARRRAQSRLPFRRSCRERAAQRCCRRTCDRRHRDDDFSFTIAIGRYCAARRQTRRADGDRCFRASGIGTGRRRADRRQDAPNTTGFIRLLRCEDRRIAALIDGVCLLFAYGGFLALFSSLGGQFTLSKLTAAVYGRPSPSSICNTSRCSRCLAARRRE